MTTKAGGAEPARTGQQTGQIRFVNIAENGNFADVGEGGKVAVVYPSLRLHLLRAMAQGMLPSVAISEWEAQAGDILRLYRTRRRDFFLIEEGAIAVEPDAVAARLSDWADMPVDLPAAEIADSEDDATLALLALQPAFLSRRIRRLEAELAAGGYAATAPDHEVLTVLDDAFAQRGTGSNYDRHASILREAELTQRLDILIQQHDRRMRDYGDASDVMARLRSEVELAQLAKSKGDRLVRSLQADNRMMLAEKLAVEARLADAGREAVALSTSLRQVIARAAEAEADVVSTRHSTSWRVTAPLRAFSRMFRKGG